MSFDDARASQDLVDTGEWTPVVQDTLRDVETSSDVRGLLDKIARGEQVERTELVSQLERMLALAARTDADFEAIAILVKRDSSLAADADILDLRVLPDGSAIVHTPWPVSSRHAVAEELASEKPDWTDEHDDPRGVPFFHASQIEIAAHASCYEDALYLLGDAVLFLRT